MEKEKRIENLAMEIFFVEFETRSFFTNSASFLLLYKTEVRQHLCIHVMDLRVAAMVDQNVIQLPRKGD